MNEPQDKHLDRLLHDWAEAKLRGRASDQDLSRRILNRVDAQQAEVNWRTGSPLAHKPARWSTRLAWFGLGAVASAATAIILAVCWTPEPVNLALPPRESSSRPADLAPQAKAFLEMQAIFGNNLAWLAETEGKVMLGLQGQAPASRASSTPITIRVELMVRQPGETEWRTSWSVDCVTLDGELVELTRADGSRNPWMVWAHVLPDGMIAVDSSLRWEGLHGEANAYDVIHRPGVRRSVFEWRHEGVEYRVFQTAATLPGGVG